MLINNGYTIYHAGLVEGSAHALLPGQWNAYRQHEKALSHQDGDGAVRRTMADPPGHYLPLAYWPPISVGDMALRSDGAGSISSSLVPTRAMSVDLTGAGQMAASAALVVSMALALSGAGSMSASIAGRLNASVSLTGSGGLATSMRGLGNMLVDMLGAGDLDATVAAYGDMAIDIVVTGTGLSTANVGQAVWSALAAESNDAGTMGAILNLLSTGGVDLEALARAILDAAQSEPIHADVRRVSGSDIGGSGTEADPWGPA